MNPSSCFCSLLGAPWHFAGHDAWPHPPQPPHPVPPHPAARTPWRLAPRRTSWRPWLGRSRSRWHRGWEGRRRDPWRDPLDPFFVPRGFLVCFVFGPNFSGEVFCWWKYRWSLKKRGFLWHQRNEFAVYGRIIQVKSKLQMPTEIFNPI